MAEKNRGSRVVSVGSRTGVTCTARRPNDEITLECDSKMDAVSVVSLPSHPGLRVYVASSTALEPEDVEVVAAEEVRKKGGEKEKKNICMD
jgi:hypothetical protein